MDSRTTYDVLVVGGGIAGLTAALSLDPALTVALAAKGPAGESSTFRAQGGIAVAVGPDDSPSLHAADTLRVGQGLCRPEAVAVLTQEGPAALEFLQSQGVKFDYRGKDPDLTREAGHSRRRGRPPLRLHRPADRRNPGKNAGRPRQRPAGSTTFS